MMRRVVCTLVLAGCGALCAAAGPAQSIGGGTIEDPATGPPPARVPGVEKFVLVKNWDFGADGTIRNISDMSAEFQYHDLWNTIGNGTNYGAVTVAPDAATALPKQPIEDPRHPVREFLASSLRTYLVPLDETTEVHPSKHNAGCGSFEAKFKLPAGGAHLKQDLLWETRVRYVTPPYYWFAIWAAGTKWDKGAEMDVIEGFGWDKGGGFNNFDGRYWHSDPVGGTVTTHGMMDWPKAMAERGVKDYKGTDWHVWTWVYRTDDTYSAYVDGIEVQSGVMHWTPAGKKDGEPIDMHFLFDGGWGHTQIKEVNQPLPASALEGKYYEWDYSRVYLSTPKEEPLKETPAKETPAPK